MAMFDLELLLAEKKALGTAFESDAIDFKQEHPTTGANGGKLYLCVTFPVKAAGTGSVSFKIQDSADGTSFADVAALTVDVADLSDGFPVALPMPLVHKRYVRLATELGTGASITAGQVTAYIGDGYELMPSAKKEGLEYFKDATPAA